MVGNTTFDAMEEQGKKLVPSNKSDSTYTINTSDGNQHILIALLLYSYCLL